MKKKIYLHFGSPKTATTSVQHFLARNRDNLLEQGILYPKSASPCGDIHHALVLDLLEEFSDAEVHEWQYGKAPKTGNWDDLIEEISKSHCQKVIVSTEIMFGYFVRNNKTKKAIEYVKEKLSDYDVQVIFYLRRQDLYIDSLYNQQVKYMFASDSLAEYKKRTPATKHTYKKIVDSWSFYFGKGNIIIRPFEKKSLLKGDILRDFMDVVGGNYERCIHNDFELNPKLPYGLIELKKMINKIEYDVPRYRDEIAEILTHLDYPEVPNNYCLLKRKEYVDILEESEIINSYLSQEYFRGQPFFQDGFPKENSLAFYDEYMLDYTKLIASFIRMKFKIKNKNLEVYRIIRKGFKILVKEIAYKKFNRHFL